MKSPRGPHQWLEADRPPTDEAVVDTLGALALVDETVPEGHYYPYLYGDADFHAWLDPIENAIEESEGGH